MCHTDEFETSDMGTIGGGETYHRVKCSIGNPTPEFLLIEKDVLLAEHVHLRVFIQHARRHDLIKDANDKRRQKGKDDIEA